MAWYDEAVFYHIYPLGLAGAPAQNDYAQPVSRLNGLLPWIDHIHEMGFTGLYIGPLFESVGHGYETTDYYKLDSRLGTNDDLKAFVAYCHDKGIKVIFDGVFNHTGRDFFAFRDLKANRENSPYRDWYCNVNFQGNNEYNDGFSYENWGGFNLLARLNQRNPQVVEYLCDVIRFWVREFDVDGLRLDAADVLDFDFMRTLRGLADVVKPDFWLMGEVIHGEYSRWVNNGMLHSVTDYALHKALFSGHNDHNYFEIAHTVNRTLGMLPGGARLYNFVDNHDVERITSKLQNRAHYLPVHVLLFTLPGIPSVYYGSEFGIEGKKEWGSDASLRPYLDPAMCQDAVSRNSHVALIAALAHLRKTCPDLVRGEYRQLQLTTGQYAFARGNVVIAVNNEDHEAGFGVPAQEGTYTGMIAGSQYESHDGRLEFTLPACGGEILALAEGDGKPGIPVSAADASGITASGIFAGCMQTMKEAEPETKQEAEPEAEPAQEVIIPENLGLEEMTVPQLQAVILKKMAGNGPVTDQMRRDVENNIWHDSLVNWAKSFR